MLALVYYWIDLIWLPILFLGVHKPHRWWALGFVVSTMILIRILSETMHYIGFPEGILNVMTSNVYTRGVVVSSLFYILFLLLAHYSSKTEGIIFMAAALSFFFMIFVTTSVVMLL